MYLYVRLELRFPNHPRKNLLESGKYIHTIFHAAGGVYAQYCGKIVFPRWSRYQENPPSVTEESHELVESLCNIYPSQNRKLALLLRSLVFVSFLCGLYCLCRGGILVEDVIGL